MKLRPASVSRRGRYQKTQALADTIIDIVNVEFAAWSVSTRQVYYQCISRGALTNCNSSYDKVQRLVVELRREGAIDYRRIVDRTRAMHKRAGWDGPQEILGALGRQYRRDLWAEQDTIVMIACEKQALEGIFAEAVDRYGASLWTTHGYGSESFLYEWSEEIERCFAEDKKVAIYYFGDWDPTGLDIERHARDRLEQHLGLTFDVGWYREGLCRDDFDRYDLVNVEVKASDTRARGFLEKHGHRAAELDALRPDVLQRRIRNAIEQHIDLTAWQRLEDRERVERESINLVVGNWDKALAAARGAA
jgi:hypothetical protein